MRNAVAIENIEEMRRQQGIDDVELREEIRALRVGDFVKLTFIADKGSPETLRVRITNIKGSTYRGKLAGEPTSAGLSRLKAGATVLFNYTHIHSVSKVKLKRDQ